MSQLRNYGKHFPYRRLYVLFWCISPAYSVLFNNFQSIESVSLSMSIPQKQYSVVNKKRGTSWLRTKTGDEQGNRVEIPNGTAAVSAEAPSWHRPVIGKLRRRWRRRIISISVSQKTYEVCSWCARAVKRRMNSALQKCGCGNFRGRTPELPQFFMLRREKHNGTGTNRNGSS